MNALCQNSYYNEEHQSLSYPKRQPRD